MTFWVDKSFLRASLFDDASRYFFLGVAATFSKPGELEKVDFATDPDRKEPSEQTREVAGATKGAGAAGEETAGAAGATTTGAAGGREETAGATGATGATALSC